MKKLISFLLVIALLVTFVSPVMADSTVSADKGLENAIKAVKEKITIPADCSKFTYNIYSQDGTSSWNLSWSNEDQQKFIYVTIDENNYISNYSSYQYTTAYDKKIPKYTRSQGREIAENFINKLNPTLLAEFKPADNNNYSQDREYYFIYERQVNGIAFPENTISISVNNYTGQVTNFNCNYSKSVKFEPADKAIDLEQAKKAFMDKLGLKLVYNMKSDKDKIVSYLAYVPKDSSRYINAITGEAEKTPNGYGIMLTGSSAMMDKMAYASSIAPEVALTPEEVDAVKGISGLLTKEELDTKVRALSQFKLDSSFTLSSAELRKDWRNKDSIIWAFRYTKVIDKETNRTRDLSLTLDAKTGDILNFWTYYDSPVETKPQMSKEEAKKICENTLQSLLPDFYSKFKYDDSYYPYDDNQNRQFSYRFVRVQNGIECPGDYVTFNYDNLSANITSMDFYWTKNLNFDDPSKAMPIEKAYDVLFDNNKLGYGIEYVSNYNIYEKVIAPATKPSPVQAVLGYFINNSKPCIISAETCEVLNYAGVAYKDNNVSDYTDIKGLYAENQVKILTQLSIRYQENELKANEQLLQKDYFILLCKLNDLYYFDPSLDNDKVVEGMYSNLISLGIITKEEKAPTSTLTREEAAKFFVKFLKLGQVAEIKGIYKSSFKDTDKINPDLLGYVCIASGLKAMNGNDGNFSPKNKMTRLEGLLSIYGYLSNK